MLLSPFIYIFYGIIVIISIRQYIIMIEMLYSSKKYLTATGDSSSISYFLKRNNY